MPKKPQDDSTSWGSVADWYAKLFEDERPYQKTVVLPNLKRLLGEIKDLDLADLACGPGFFAATFAGAGARVTGVDIAPELLAFAKERAPDIHWVQAPAHLTGLPDASADLVTIVLAIQNIAEAGDTFRECFRILRPSGTLHIVMNHPAFRIPKRSAWGWDERSETQYRRLDGYLTEAKTEILMHPGSDQSAVTFSFHRPLQFYVKALARAGFGISNAEEWTSDRVSDSGPRAAAENTARREFPLFLYLAARKV